MNADVAADIIDRWLFTFIENSFFDTENVRTFWLILKKGKKKDLNFLNQNRDLFDLEK